MPTATPATSPALSAPRIQAAAQSRFWLSAAQREELSLALVLSITVSLFPRWRIFEQAWVRDFAGVKALPWPWYVSILFVVVGLLLTLPTSRRSGLHLGSIREHWRGVLLVCGGSVLVAALVYPQLPVRPWSGMPATMWALSPLGQQLIFQGYLYGRLEQSFPGVVHVRVPVARALVLTVCFFAFWHVPNFLGRLPVGYVFFQLFYTSVLAIIPGLARQWTGSIWYGVLCHSAINFIAWYVP